MAEFLTTKSISTHIGKIMQESRSKLALVSPYLQLSMNIFHLLKDASNRNVQIKLIFGKKNLNKSEKKLLKQIENLELFFLKDLHSKCYLNEKNLVITSMNLIEYSQQNNREMGILFERGRDDIIFNQVIEEIKSILASSNKIDLFGTDDSYTGEFKQKRPVPRGFDFEKSLYRNLIDGYCIRCGSIIEYNPDEPYCGSCFSTWKRFRNINYSENACHSCGNSYESTINKPECYGCYTQY